MAGLVRPLLDMEARLPMEPGRVPQGPHRPGEGDYWRPGARSEGLPVVSRQLDAPDVPA